MNNKLRGHVEAKPEPSSTRRPRPFPANIDSDWTFEENSDHLTICRCPPTFRGIQKRPRAGWPRYAATRNGNAFRLPPSPRSPGRLDAPPSAPQRNSAPPPKGCPAARPQSWSSPKPRPSNGVSCIEKQACRVAFRRFWGWFRDGLETDWHLFSVGSGLV